MAYFWHCPICGQLETFADDEDAVCRWPHDTLKVAGMIPISDELLADTPDLSLVDWDGEYVQPKPPREFKVPVFGYVRKVRSAVPGWKGWRLRFWWVGRMFWACDECGGSFVHFGSTDTPIGRKPW